MIVNLPKRVAKKSISVFKSTLLSFPRKVQCNICGWTGRRFLSDPWHKYVNCLRCHSGIRQRLFFAAMQNLDDLSFDVLFRNKSVLHFAPEKFISSHIQDRAAYYNTADYERSDCDFKSDMSNMPEVKDESFDVVMAFDVLEHVPDYQKALKEVHRILSPKGSAVLTVPQKDGLDKTYQDPDIVTPEDKMKHFGQQDHLRIFGDDFQGNVEKKGFMVTAVDESFFSEEMGIRHVLFPPLLSKHPLATNYRKVFFCQKY